MCISMGGVGGCWCNEGEGKAGTRMVKTQVSNASVPLAPVMPIRAQPAPVALCPQSTPTPSTVFQAYSPHLPAVRPSPMDPLASNASVLPAPVTPIMHSSPEVSPPPNASLRDLTISASCLSHWTITQGPSGADCRHSHCLIHLGLLSFPPADQITIPPSIYTSAASAPQSTCPP